LLRKEAVVDYFDPYVENIEIKIEEGLVKMKSVEILNEETNNYDLVLILTDHSGFDYENLANKAKLVVDTRNAIKSRNHKNVFRL
jgi:UDP-N-acetyl-D-glucosamine dehydrogenase